MVSLNTVKDMVSFGALATAVYKGIDAGAHYLRCRTDVLANTTIGPAADLGAKYDFTQFPICGHYIFGREGAVCLLSLALFATLASIKLSGSCSCRINCCGRQGSLKVGKEE